MKAPIVSIVLIAILTALFMTPVNLLTIEINETRSYLYRQLAPVGTTFKLKISHSVHASPVIEGYEIKADGQIYLVSANFKDLGWGMAEEAHLNVEEGALIVDNQDRLIKRVPFRVSYITDPALYIEEDWIPLKELVEDRQRLDIYTEKISLWHYLWMEKKAIESEKFSPL